MIDKSKQYRTRDGREVRIYATDGTKRKTVHGAILCEDGWNVYQWFPDGSVFNDVQSDRDLIEVRPRIKFNLYVKVYNNGRWLAYDDRAANPPDSDGGKILTFPIDIEVPE